MGKRNRRNNFLSGPAGRIDRNDDHSMRNTFSPRDNNGIHRGNKNQRFHNQNPGKNHHHGPVRFGNQNLNWNDTTPTRHHGHARGRGRGGRQNHSRRSNSPNVNPFPLKITPDISLYTDSYSSSDEDFDILDQPSPFITGLQPHSPIAPCSECQDSRKRNLKFRDDCYGMLDILWKGLLRWSKDINIPFGGIEDDMDWQFEPTIRIEKQVEFEIPCPNPLSDDGKPSERSLLDSQVAARGDQLSPYSYRPGTTDAPAGAASRPRMGGMDNAHYPVYSSQELLSGYVAYGGNHQYNPVNSTMNNPTSSWSGSGSGFSPGFVPVGGVHGARVEPAMPHLAPQTSGRVLISPEAQSPQL